MITNVGKNIIAKYLIGEAPAYASFMALGCGPKPRKNITTLSDVDTFEYSGTIQISLGETRITGMATTAGLLAGMTIAKIAGGTGDFNEESQVATIVAVNSSSSITISTEGGATAGSISFYVFGSYSVLRVVDSSPLWRGARLSQFSSFAGSLDSSAITTVDKIIALSIPPSEQLHLVRITPGPTSEKIENALLTIGTDPRINTLEFESIRVPISSRGYVNDNGTNKIILTAQLPSEERYEFTEVGIYSAGSNRSAGFYDSKTISAFSATEGWELNANNTVSGPSTLPTAPFLESDLSIINSSNNITLTQPAIKIRATNGIFANETRIERYERTRYLDNVFLVRGDNSFIYNSGLPSWTIDSNPKFLQLEANVIDLSRNSSSDLLKLAFSIVSVNGSSSGIVPTDTFVIVEFANNNNSQIARMQIQINKEDYDLARNRYIVSTKKLEDLLYITDQFSWKTINTIRVYASTTRDLAITRKQVVEGSGVATITTGLISHDLSVGDKVFISGVAASGQDLDGLKTVLSVSESGTMFTYATTSSVVPDQPVSGNFKTVDDRFYIALDALRIDNVNTVNPLYGLTGYSIIQDELEKSIVKSPNTTNFIEYRFVLDVT
jgi:hypothetical protein